MWILKKLKRPVGDFKF